MVVTVRVTHLMNIYLESYFFSSKICARMETFKMYLYLSSWIVHLGFSYLPWLAERDSSYVHYHVINLFMDGWFFSGARRDLHFFPMTAMSASCMMSQISNVMLNRYGLGSFSMHQLLHCMHFAKNWCFMIRIRLHEGIHYLFECPNWNLTHQIHTHHSMGLKVALKLEVPCKWYCRVCNLYCPQPSGNSKLFSTSVTEHFSPKSVMAGIWHAHFTF